ncbi:hypothetical protein [Edaphobacter bradus]|uniref:hypothetical protein n=1 Tax=Edaphobacter bradus TaxID=2259016 RepID=UPI0021DFD58B|nr:hypothetical protein [Edaphobacter bradus]
MRRKIFLVCVPLLGCAGAFGLENAPATVDWKAMLPAVRSSVRQAFPKEAAQAHYPASVSQTADVTGMGLSEALVDLGSGAYTDELTLLRMEGDRPVVARFRGKNDKVGSMVFLNGLSEGNGEAVELRPKEHVVYSGHWIVNGTKVKRCRGEAYQWDGVAKGFSFDRKLSKTLTREFCQKVEADLTKHSPLSPSTSPGVRSE